MTAYTEKHNALRAARAALKAKHAEPMSGVHFRLEQTEAGWVWHEIDVATGDLASGELVTEGVKQPAVTADAPAVEAPATEVKETREQKRLRKIREADERNAARHRAKAEAKAAKPAPAPKAAAAPKAKGEPKPGGKVATKVAELLRLVQSPEGLTETQLKTITGWTKFGGFYAAVKEAGLVMTREKVGGENVWKARAAETQAKAA